MDADEVFKSLGNRRRRQVLYLLSASDERRLEVSWLVDVIAHYEEGGHPKAQTRKNVYNAVQQTGNEKMANAGIIDMDERTWAAIQNEHTEWAVEVASYAADEEEIVGVLSSADEVGWP